MLNKFNFLLLFNVNMYLKLLIIYKIKNYNLNLKNYFMNDFPTKGTKIKIKFNNNEEEVTIGETKFVGKYGTEFVTLERENDSSYCLAKTRIIKIIVKN